MHRLLVLLVVMLVAVPAGAQAPVSAAAAPGIEGRITADGRSLSGATVQAIQSGAIIASDTTDASGRYDLDLPAAGTYDIRVVPPLGAPFTGTVASGVVVDESIVTVLDIQLRSPLGTLLVTVRALEEGTAVPVAVTGAQVSLSAADLPATSATTDSSGVARLVTRPGSYALRIDAPSPWTTDSLLPAGTAITTAQGAVDVTVAGEALTVQIPTTTLTVTTTRQSDGMPATGATVRADVFGAPVDLGADLTGTARFFTTPIASDAFGVVTHKVLPASNVSVIATPPSTDPLLIRASATTDVPPTGGAVTVALPPTPVQPVNVRFLDAAGNPVEGATVRSTVQTALTDTEGDATVLARSDVNTELRVTKFSTDPALPEAITFRRNIQPVSPGLDLVARARVGTVTVTVTRDRTTPVSNASVNARTTTLVDPDGWTVQSSVGSKLTNDVGQTTLRQYPTTALAEFSASGGGLFGFKEATIPDGPSSVTIDLEPLDPPGTGANTTVTGRVVTSGGIPIVGLDVRAGATGTRLATTSSTGSFSFDYPTGPDPQSLRLRGSDLHTRENDFGRSLPVSLQVVIPNVFTPSTPTPIDLGNIELPIDELEVRVVDQVGAGINSIEIGSQQRESRFPVTVGGEVLQARGTSGYPTPSSTTTTLTDLIGDATLHLLPGAHEVQLVRDFNFSGVTLPISAFASVALATDDIVQISLTRPKAALLTTLDGTPKVSDDPLTLEGPRPRLIPVVERPDGFQDGTTSTQGELLDWVLCETDNGIGEVAVLRESCPGDAQITIRLFDEEDCDIRDCARLPEFPEYPVTIRVAFKSGIGDGAGSFLNEGWRAQEVTILPPVDRPPRIAIVGDEEFIEGPEGSIATFQATATDDNDGVEVSWDLDLDGIGEVAGETLLFDLPDGPGFGAINVIATDSSGQSTSTEVYWVSNNVAPHGELQVSGPDGTGIVQVAVVDITDPSADDLAGGIGVSLDLDRDGAGIFETAGSTSTIDTTGLADGSYDVRARLVDRDGGQRILTGSFRVGAPPPNVAPTVDPGGPYTVGEGGTILLDASADDPDGDPVTITWAIPGQGSALANPVTFDATGLDGSTTVDVTVTACDTPPFGDPECTPETVTVTVTNVAPSVTVGNVSGTAGTAVTLPVSVTDPAPTDVLTVNVDWGDGTTPDVITPYTGAPVTHTYADDGLYTVSVVASDDDGGTTPATATATITAVLPPQPPPPVELRLTVEGGEGTVAPGARFTYRSTLSNASTDVDAEGVVMTIALDPSLSVVAPSPLTLGVLTPRLTDPWSCTGTTTIRCVLNGPLTAGSNVVLDVPVVVDQTATGKLTTNFSVSADTELTGPVDVERATTLMAVIDSPGPGPTEPDPTPILSVTPDPVTPTPSVTPTPIITTLPETGSDIGTWLAAAIGLLLLGLLSRQLAQRPRPGIW